MAYTRTWDAAYEALPAAGDLISDGDDKIRNFKTDVRERLAKDHYMDIAGTDADHGEHSKVTLRVGSAPTHAANKGFLYAKDVSAKAELFYIDEDGNEVQVTSGGVIPGTLPSGTKMWFYQNTAPTGWTVDSTPADALLAVKGGTAAYNANGGTQAGTWTQTGHTHAAGTFGVSGTTSAESGGYAQGAYNVYNFTLAPHTHTFSAAVTGTSASGAEAATWRPLAQLGIICTKD
jgi:hypothetical protein